MSNRTQTRTIPALDTTPAGHLPHLVQTPEDTRQRPADLDTAEPTRGPRETTETFDRAKVIAALPTVIDEAMRKALPDYYSAETAAALTARMVAHLNGTACPIYTDCTITEPGHHDHFNSIKVTDATDGSTILDAGIVALSAAPSGMESSADPHAIVWIRNAEFTDAAAVHAKTAQLRRFLDGVDAMADRAFADHEAHTAQAGGAA